MPIGARALILAAGLERALPMLKISDLTPEMKEQIKEQYGKPGRDLHMVEHADLDYVVLVVPPTPFEYKRFKDFAQKGKQDKAQEALLASCVVYPPAAELQEYLDEKPAFNETLTDVVLTLAGVMQEAQAKKF